MHVTVYFKTIFKRFLGLSVKLVLNTYLCGQCMAYKGSYFRNTNLYVGNVPQGKLKLKKELSGCT